MILLLPSRSALLDKSMYPLAAAMLDSMKATISKSGLRSVQANTDGLSGITRRQANITIEKSPPPALLMRP